ncbi:MAG: 30S ribosomal protein S7 [Acidobacteria bacterium]|nr:30S ribosomal protein S7 [Acidobacteriota bacterium]MBI3657463.1 30S ribosomal protein S7 [Acidobacteriota bacterium]
MARRREASKRETIADPVYSSELVSKFVSCMMIGGKKTTAERVFYSCMEILKNRTKEDALKMFKKAVDAVKPQLEVKSRRIGGATYQVPVEVSSERRISLGIRWILACARDRGEKSMTERLAGELLDAINNRGGAVKKREDTHRMAEANKAFAHYRWGG